MMTRRFRQAAWFGPGPVGIACGVHVALISAPDGLPSLSPTLVMPRHQHTRIGVPTTLALLADRTARHALSLIMPRLCTHSSNLGGQGRVRARALPGGHPQGPLTETDSVRSWRRQFGRHAAVGHRGPRRGFGARHACGVPQHAAKGTRMRRGRSTSGTGRAFTPAIRYRRSPDVLAPPSALG